MEKDKTLRSRSKKGKPGLELERRNCQSRTVFEGMDGKKMMRQPNTSFEMS